MGLAIGASKITTGANAANINVPTVLAAGQQDQAAPQAISETAFKLIPTRQKAFVSIPNAVHRSFDSTYCAQAQAAGASADTTRDGRVDPEEVAAWTTYRPLDRHTLSGIVGPTPSGTAMQYCSSAFFTTPVDIGPLVTAVTDPDGPGPQTGTVVPCLSFDQQTQRCTRYDMPTTGLNTEQVKLGVSALAATFFGTVLKRGGAMTGRMSRAISPQAAEKHEPRVGSANRS